MIIASAVWASEPLRALARHHVAVAASAKLPVAAWGPVSRALGTMTSRTSLPPGRADLGGRRPTPAIERPVFGASGDLRSSAVVVGMRLQTLRLRQRVRYGGGRRASGSGQSCAVPAGAVIEWYANVPLGLEQGFTLTSRPAVHGPRPLTLAIALSAAGRRHVLA
jgi:hypothetical protein